MQVAKSREFLIKFCSLKCIAKIRSEVLNLYICARTEASKPLPHPKEWVARKQTLILAADVFVIAHFAWQQSSQLMISLWVK